MNFTPIITTWSRPDNAKELLKYLSKKDQHTILIANTEIEFESKFGTVYGNNEYHAFTRWLIIADLINDGIIDTPYIFNLDDDIILRDGSLTAVELLTKRYSNCIISGWGRKVFSSYLDGRFTRSIEEVECAGSGICAYPSEFIRDVIGLVDNRISPAMRFADDTFLSHAARILNVKQLGCHIPFNFFYSSYSFNSLHERTKTFTKELWDLYSNATSIDELVEISTDSFDGMLE